MTIPRVSKRVDVKVFGEGDQARVYRKNERVEILEKEELESVVGGKVFMVFTNF